MGADEAIRLRRKYRADGRYALSEKLRMSRGLWHKDTGYASSESLFSAPQFRSVWSNYERQVIASQGSDSLLSDGMR